MGFQRGTVVRSKAGHDKGSFFAVLSHDGDTALIADGKTRTLSSPKRKKLKHLAFTNTVLSEQTMNDDTKIRLELAPFDQRVRAD